MDIIIPEIVEMCIKKLKNEGYEAFVVGGCVRDSIIGRQPNDWDVCTSALPKDTKEVFKEYKTIDIGIDHGTVAVVIHKETIEITTYRVDGEYKDNRRPEKVAFTSNIEEDLSRRDFTINAIAYNNEVGLVDFFNGREDIEGKLIRCVGNPVKRFNEDALRIMRALRFAAQLNYLIEKQTLEAIKGNKELLRNISVERIAVELNKLVMADNPENMINLLFEMDIFKIIIEFMHNCNLKVDKTSNFIEKCGQIIKKCPKDLSIRLCVLLNFIIEGYGLGENLADERESEKANTTLAEKILKGLKYDNCTIKEVSTLSLYYHSNILCDKIHIKRLLNSIDMELLKKLMVMKAAVENQFNSASYMKILSTIEENRECFKIKDLKINGRDLLALGIKDGKVIGEMLNAFLHMVIENPEMNNREKLLEVGKKLAHCV